MIQDILLNIPKRTIKASEDKQDAMMAFNDDCLKLFKQCKSKEEFDNAVIETSKTFGDVPGIQYSLFPGDDETLGNCNTSSTTLLLKAGASKEQINTIESQMSGWHWGFGTEKPWTFEEQNNAIKEAQKELNKKLQSIDVIRGH